MSLPKTNSGYLGNPLVKRDGVEHPYTEEEVQEYSRCMEDPVYFAEKYIKVINLDQGLIQFKPYKYQRKMLKHFDDNRFSIILACRQSGKSISSIVGKSIPENCLDKKTCLYFFLLTLFNVSKEGVAEDKIILLLSIFDLTTAKSLA